MSTVIDKNPTQQSTNSASTSRILVVDDESSISDLIATSLRFVGFEVRTAATGDRSGFVPGSIALTAVDGGC